MAKLLHDLTGYRVGDIITLSDLQTQADYGKMRVDFIIREVRTYFEPNDVFKYYGYIVEAPLRTGQTAPDNYMILVKSMQQAFEAYIYFKDTGASGLLHRDAEPACLLLGAFNEELTDLKSRIEVDVTDESGTHPVTWDRQNCTYGVEFKSTSEGESICSLGEYYTADQNGGNNYCLMDWRGNTTKGFLETWYGCMVQNSEIDMYHK